MRSAVIMGVLGLGAKGRSVRMDITIETAAGHVLGCDRPECLPMLNLDQEAQSSTFNVGANCLSTLSKLPRKSWVTSTRL